MGLYDNHNHCSFSFDAGGTSVESSARAAIEQGLDGMCFTDHYDFYTPDMKLNLRQGHDDVFDIPGQQAEIDKVQRLLDSQGHNFRIFKGIEMGLQKDCRDKIRQLMREHSFDEVIASVHYLDGTDPFYGTYYSGLTWQQSYGHYLETLYEEMVWLDSDFDIMGHYDYVTRYGPYPKASILYGDFPDLLDTMFKYLIENGKALEINTKTYQTFADGRTPILDDALLLRYKELGGEALSLGSDSHKASAVGFHLPDFAAKLKALGFRWEVHFESRRMVMTPL